MRSRAALACEAFTGVPAMEKLHHDLVRELDVLAHLDNRDFLRAYEQFVQHVEQTFRIEEQWMEALEFAGLQCHQEQHARVLGALHNTHGQALRGDLHGCRNVARDLFPPWFAFHRLTMDATFAAVLQITPSSTLTPIVAPSGNEMTPASQ